LVGKEKVQGLFKGKGRRPRVDGCSRVSLSLDFRLFELKLRLEITEILQKNQLNNLILNLGFDRRMTHCVKQ